MSKTKIAIIGSGGIAQITHLPVLAKMDEVELVAICDSDKSKSRLIAQKYSIKNFYTDVNKMLDETSAEGGAEAVIISTPTHLHKEHAIKSLSKGLHTLVEKPLGRNTNEAQEIVEAAKKSKKQLMVGMNNRFRPDIMMQESFISAKELGDIFYIKAGFLKKKSTVENWSIKKSLSGGGVFMDLGIVILDIALWLLKFPKVKSVSAVNYYHKKMEVEDSSFVMIRFENGATVTLESSWNLHRENDLFYCNVFGSEGSAGINPLKIYKTMHGNLMNVTPQKMENPSNIFKRSYEYELKHFVNTIQTNSLVISSGEEALHRMRIVEAVYKSARLGKEINFK